MTARTRRLSFWISSVEVLRSTHAPQLDVVRVRGLVSTEGWESAELVPITKGIPSDGVLDLMLVAEAPGDSTVPTSYPEIEAIFAIEPGHPFKGVRVHGAANRVVLKNFPGYTEAGDPPKGCVACSGKLFVARGQSAPAGRAAETVVHEEDLPRNLRIIHENEGIGSLDSDPKPDDDPAEREGRDHHRHVGLAVPCTKYFVTHPSCKKERKIMKVRNIVLSCTAGASLLCAIAFAQGVQPPYVNIDRHRHGNLAAAQSSIVDAFNRISDAQRANDGQLGGHAERAKQLLSQANEELRLAADVSNENRN